MRFLIVLLSVLSATPSFALPKSRPAAATAPLSVASKSEPLPNERFLLDVTLTSIAESFHTGFYGRYENALAPGELPLKGGARVGFLYGPNTPKTWLIPVQGELTWEFEESKGMIPYFGIAMGMAILHANESKVDLPTYEFGGMTFGGGSVGTPSSTAVKFAALVRPGFHVGPNFHAEIPFGSIAGTLAFGLSAGMRL